MLCGVGRAAGHERRHMIMVRKTDDIMIGLRVDAERRSTVIVRRARPVMPKRDRQERLGFKRGLPRP
jgi:hypothetical protein